jgi:DNA-binding transcriptional ArsR family regulator
VYDHPDADELRLTDVMSALSDPIRVGVVRLLADGTERNYGDLSAPVAKSTLSHHMTVLRNAGVTYCREEGNRSFVRLRREALDIRFPDLLDAVLTAADATDVGQQVALVGGL